MLSKRHLLQRFVFGQVAVLADLGLQQGDWGEKRIALPQLPKITRGLGVTLGIRFGGFPNRYAKPGHQAGVFSCG